MGQVALLDRSVDHHPHPACGKPEEEVELGPAASDVVEHLVGRAAGPVEVGHVVNVEVADSPRPVLPGCHERLHPLDGLGQGNAAAPVEEVEVEAIGLEPAKAALAGPGEPIATGFVRIDLADEDDPIPEAGEGVAEKGLGRAVAAYFSGVDQDEPEVDPRP